jgi:hypothetical protein
VDSLLQGVVSVEKILAYGAKSLGIIGGYEAKGVATSAEHQFVSDITEADKSLSEFSESFNESFRSGAALEKEVAKYLAQGNFGERLSTEVLSTEGHRILHYKPDVAGTNQGGTDIVTLRADVVYFVYKKALTTGRKCF